MFPKSNLHNFKLVVSQIVPRRFQSSPPSYFKSHANPPKTLDELRSSPDSHASHASPASSQYVPAFPPPSYKIPQYQLAQQVTPQQFPVKSSSSSFRDICIGIGALATGAAFSVMVGTLFLKTVEQEEKLEQMKKKHRDVIIQTQEYKKKLEHTTVNTIKKDILVQGRMQMHIAMLRDQLNKAGVNPVTVDAAIRRFETDVKMESTATAIELWVPGEVELKALIPDAHEYDKTN